MKAVRFIGSVREDLRAFPEKARQRAGEELMRVQYGADPTNWRPMMNVGAGTREIRIKVQPGIFRVFYVAKFDEAIYVLHAFQKKTQKTRTQDLEIGRQRYREMLIYRDNDR